MTPTEISRNLSDIANRLSELEGYSSDPQTKVFLDKAMLLIDQALHRSRKVKK